MSEELKEIETNVSPNTEHQQNFLMLRKRTNKIKSRRKEIQRSEKK